MANDKEKPQSLISRSILLMRKPLRRTSRRFVMLQSMPRKRLAAEELGNEEPISREQAEKELHEAVHKVQQEQKKEK